MVSMWVPLHLKPSTSSPECCTWQFENLMVNTHRDNQAMSDSPIFQSQECMGKIEHLHGGLGGGGGGLPDMFSKSTVSMRAVCSSKIRQLTSR